MYLMREYAMYKMADVCAVIVSYNCTNVIFENIHSLLKQTAQLLIIDNASCERSKNILSRYENEPNIMVVYCRENAGIAKRLNDALFWAADHGYKLLLTMDQDTVLHDNCVRHMLEVLNADVRNVSVGPNRKTKNDAAHPKNSWNIDASYLITSGNLVKVDNALYVGGYMTDLFIDLVDIEFSLALRSAGNLLKIAKNARMDHKVGEYEFNSLMGFNFCYLSHSPKRFYYIYRNHVIIIKKYFLKYPFFCMKMMFFLTLDSFKVIFEKKSKEKIKEAFKGIIDGMKFILKRS